MSSRLEILEMFLANSFALSDAEDNTYRLLSRGGIADLPLLRTLLAMYQKPQEPSFREVLRLFCFIRIWKFWSIKNSFAVITNRTYKYQTHFWGFVKTDHLLTLSQNLLATAEVLKLKITPRGTLLKWSKRLPISMRKVKSCVMKQDLSVEIRTNCEEEVVLNNSCS